MIIFLVIIHILAICVSTYMLLLERKYCKHCEWWCDGGAWMFFILDLIPFVGILTSIGGCADYVKNIINELDKKH